MEEEGTVSLWLGTATSRGALEEAMEVTFSEDGDFLGSPFSRAFGIEYYDEGLREAEYFDQPSGNLEALLKGASYDNVIIERFHKLGTPQGRFNCAVLLHNYRHNGRQDWKTDKIHLEFAGSIKHQ